MSARDLDDMSRERLERIIAAYGADPMRWPEGERDAAQRLLARSPAARDMLAHSRQLDEALARLDADLPDGALARLVAATAFPPPRETRSPSLLDRLAYVASAFWPRTAVLASMAALGILVGVTTEQAYSGFDGSTLVIDEIGADIVEELAP